MPFTHPQHYDIFAIMNPLYVHMNKSIIDCIRALHHTHRSLRILELGAGTGLLARTISKQFPQAHIIAVEPNKSWHEHATLSKNTNIQNILANPMTYQSKNKADIVLMRFYYHHVPDKDKQPLLSMIRKNLKANGVLIIIEECLQNYQNNAQRVRADQQYHRYRIALARRSGDRGYVAYQTELARNHCCPYKVSSGVLAQHLRAAHFSIAHSEPLYGGDTSINYKLLGHTLVVATTILRR